MPSPQDPSEHRTAGGPSMAQAPEAVLGELAGHLRGLFRVVSAFVNQPAVQGASPEGARKVQELAKLVEENVSKVFGKDPFSAGQSSLQRVAGSVDASVSPTLFINRLNRSLAEALAGARQRDLARSLQASSSEAASPGQATSASPAATFTGETFSLGEVLQFLAFNAKDGEVEIEAMSGEVIWLQLLAGQVVGAASKKPRPGLRLGEILVIQGALSKEALREVIADPRARGRPLGQVLLERELISAEQLAAALEHQALFFFRECGRLKTRSIRFSTAIDRERSVDFQLDLTWLLLEGARESDERTR